MSHQPLDLTQTDSLKFECLVNRDSLSMQTAASIEPQSPTCESAHGV
ncbi:hypothetical protein [Burkholderia sp. S171]|nr:hypothetical protein [Burkholderia sp. S171]